MNTVVLIGRLTKDLELKATQSNISFVNGTIAVNRPFKDEKGETQADFISFVAWRAQAENAAKYCSKGSLIGIQGRIQTRNYEDDNGQTRYVTEVSADNITFLEPKKQEQKPTDDDTYETSVKVDDEDLPF